MTFGLLAKWLLQQIVTMSKEVHLVCDVYTTPSIKDAERERRGNDSSVYIITGPDQTRPKDWQLALRSSSFKIALIQFLEAEWEKPEYMSVLGECRLYLNVNNGCVCFSAVGDSIQKANVEELKAYHEEADTRMVFHLDFINVVQRMARVVIRSCDTDVLVILFHYLAKAGGNVNVWMDAGRDSNNTRRLININRLVHNLTKDVALALPGLHAFTGCDYVPAFLNKGKTKPFELMKKDNRYIQCMKSIGEEELSEQTISMCEMFTCHVYGQQNESSVNKARFEIFKRTYAPKSTEDPLGSMKGINPRSLPPCAATLHCQMKRANFVAAMWKRANLRRPCIGMPNGHGWTLHENTYQLHWYDGDQLPKDIYRVLEANTGVMDEEIEDEDIAYGENIYGADEVFDDEY